MSDIRMRYLDLPYKVHAFTVREDVDSYDVYVNSHLCYDAQLKAYEHELAHIRNEDFEMFDVNDVERWLL